MEIYNRFDKEIDTFIFSNNEFINTQWRKWGKKDKLFVINKIANQVAEKYKYYAESKPIVEFCKDSVFHLYESLSKDLNVLYLSSSFLKNVKQNVKKIIESVSNLTFYKAFGDISGFIVIGEKVVVYSIQEKGVFFASADRKQRFGDFLQSVVHRGDVPICADEMVDETIMLGLAVLILKYFGCCETFLVAGNVKRVVNANETKETIVNKAPFKINYLDCSWLRNIVHTDGVLVKGHIRWQACGIMWKERKLIFIQPHKREYTRRAGKCKAQEPEIMKAFCQNAA